MGYRYLTTTHPEKEDTTVVADTYTENVKKLKLMAGQLYLRDCATIESGGIILPAKSRASDWCSVEAIGATPKNELSATDKHRFNLRYRPILNLKVGDIISMPLKSMFGLHRSPYSMKEYIVNSLILETYIEEDADIKVKPIGDRVLIRYDEERVADGIVVRESRDNNYIQGTVANLGTGSLTKYGERIMFTVKVGDKVIIPKSYGIDMKYDNAKYKIIKATDIVSKV